MNLKRLLNSETGVTFISILLGIGLATIFRKVCTDKNCITFKGPIISEIHDHVYKYNDKCYRFEEEPVTCDKTKKIIDIETSEDFIKQSFVSQIYGPNEINF